MSADPQKPGQASAEAPPAASLTGTTIERYAVEALIGRGGMGEVYRATDSRLKRKVALKVLRPDKDRPDAVARLFREARAAASLTHPNTVAIHDIGEEGGLFYIVMELVSGVPLLAYVGDDRVPLARKLRWLTDIARALSCAHRAGVLHRDVKPSNIMVSDDDVAKVLDFGLAKPVEPKSFDFRTQVGRMVGTARYMSPEQLAGADADPRSDQYAFGVTAYELLSGTYPAGAPLTSPPPLDTIVSGFPKHGAEVIARTMNMSAGERFGSMNDVVTALEDVAHNRPVRGSISPAEPPAALAPTAELPAKRRSRPSIADTERDPNTASSDRPDVTVAPAPAAGAEPIDLNATMPGSLRVRRAAHARAHEAARTLLSRAPLEQQTRERKNAPGRSKTASMDGRPPRHSGPATLASPSPLAAGAPRVVAAPVAIVAPPIPPPALVAPSTPPPAAATAAPARPSSTLTIVIIAVVLLALAAFAGTYLGARARMTDPQAPANAPSGAPSAR